MDAKKTGLLISARRRELGLTQTALAEKLNVTDKAVSRWETGRGFPELGILIPLSEALGLRVEELLAGELIPAQDSSASGSAIVDALKYFKNQGRNIVTALCLAGAFILGPIPLISVGISAALYGVCLVLALLLTAAALLPHIRLGSWSGRRLRRGAVFTILAAIGLELLPYGAVLSFARPADDGTIGRFRETYSYFSLMPFGYANFGQLITAVLSVVILVLLIISFKAHRIRSFTFGLSIAAVIFSVLPFVIFGYEYMSLVGLGITALLILAVFLQAAANGRD